MITFSAVDEYFEQMFEAGSACSRGANSGWNRIPNRGRSGRLFYTSTSSIRWPRA